MMSVKPPRTLSVEETAAAQALLARAVPPWPPSLTRINRPSSLVQAMAVDLPAMPTQFGRSPTCDVEESGMGSADGAGAALEDSGDLRDACEERRHHRGEEGPEEMRQPEVIAGLLPVTNRS